MGFQKRILLSLIACASFQARGGTTSDNCPTFLATVALLSGQAAATSREVKALPIREQAGETCASHAVTSSVEHRIMRYSGEAISLSSDYLFLMTLSDRIMTLFMQGLARQTLKPTPESLTPWLSTLFGVGKQHRVFKYEYPIMSGIKTFGLIPESAWRTGNAIERAFENGTLDKALKENAATIAGTMMNSDKFMQALIEVLRKVVGKPLPWDFEFQGTTYNPRTFRQRFDRPETGWSIWDECVEYHDPAKLLKVTGTKQPGQFGQFVTLKKFSFEHVHALIKRKIDAGIPLLASIYSEEDPFKKGHMHVDLKVRASTIHNPTRHDQIQTLIDRYKATHPPDHAVLVVGYAADEVGHISYLKLQNSWGKTRGINGYVYVDYLTFLAIASDFRPVD